MSLLRAEIARLRRRRLTWGVVAVLAATQVVVVAGTISASGRPPLSVLSGPDYVFDHGSGLEALLIVCYASLAVGGLVLGAGYAGGAPARATSPPTWSGRGRLLAARLAVAAGAALALSAVGTAVFLGGSGLLALAADGAGIPAAVWGRAASLAGRGVALAAAAAALGAALAVLTRRTVAALGVAAGYVLVWEVGVRAVTAAAGGSGARWYLLTHAGTWLTGRAGNWAGSGLVLAAALGLTTLAAIVSLRRDPA